MRLYQIPFSHNCIKVRHVLDLKGIEYETVDINPAARRGIKRVSGQELTPVLVDGTDPIAGSTPILLHLEEKGIEPGLLPEDPQERAECLVLMDWADAVFMALSRRLAYSSVLANGNVGDLFFPDRPARVRHAAGRVAALVLRRRFGISAKSDREDLPEVRRAARLALDRLAGRPHLVGERTTLADVTLAAMTAPLQVAVPAVREDPSVASLLGWAQEVLGKDFAPRTAPVAAGV